MYVIGSLALTNRLAYTSASYFVFNVSFCITILNRVFVNINMVFSYGCGRQKNQGQHKFQANCW
jgi:hypothetical protein